MYVESVEELDFKLDRFIRKTIDAESDAEVGVGKGWKKLVVLVGADVGVFGQLLVNLQGVSRWIALDVNLVAYAFFWVIKIRTCWLVETLNLALMKDNRKLNRMCDS